MTDQGPRYEVFKQEREGAPFRNVGSVHAPDAELALLAARDVFARRPACHSLWVVPAAAIVARSVQEPLPDAPPGPAQPYAVCAKQSQRQAMTYVDYLGWIEAHSAAEALRLAPAAFDAAEATVWRAFPEAAVPMSAVSYTHLRAHEPVLDILCRLLLEKKKTNPDSRHPRLYKAHTTLSYSYTSTEHESNTLRIH